MSRAPSRHPFLSAETAASIAKTVRDAERFWIRRHPTAPSYTLGAACYLDVPSEGIQTYYRRTTTGNGLLRARFGALYDELPRALERIFGEEFRYTSRYALPGFHVFRGGDGFELLEPKIHFDLQDLDLDWDDDGARPEDTRISFTVPVEMPASGAGLWVWDVEYSKVQGFTEDEVLATNPAPPTLMPYELGALVIHSGDRLHQIAKTDLEDEDEARITFQGHARKTNGTWILYW